MIRNYIRILHRVGFLHGLQAKSHLETRYYVVVYNTSFDVSVVFARRGVDVHSTAVNERHLVSAHARKRRVEIT